MIRTSLCFLLVLGLYAPFSAAQSFLDPGFESYTVDSGKFTKTNGGPWRFGHDAGVTQPFAPNTSLAVLNTWSAQFPAFEGEQYASTFSGSDVVVQTVDFPEPGPYLLSVYAASPSGMVNIQGTELTLQNGEFQFAVHTDLVGQVHEVPMDAGWMRYEAVFRIDTPGPRNIGMVNQAEVPYFVNYDSVSVTKVPEPSTLIILIASLASCLAVSKRIVRSC